MTEDVMPVDRYRGRTAQLLTLGAPPTRRLPWRDYLALGFTAEDVPVLLKMATGEELHRAPSESPEVWAPVHAWRTLGQLRATSATMPLLELLDQRDGDDTMLEDLPVVFALFGSAILADLATYLAETRRDLWARIAVAEALKELAMAEPDRRDPVVAALTAPLAKWYRNSDVLNGFLIMYLAELGATEASPVMREAFADGRVDVEVNGDWEDTQIQMGLLSQRTTAAPRPSYWPDPVSLVAPRRRPSRSEGKTKAQRKAARKARKRNRPKQ